MPDLPDWFTLVAEIEAEAYKFRGGADASKPATPTSRDVYYATDTRILYICRVDGAWININLLYLLLAGGTMTGNIIMGGNKLTGLGAPAAAGDSLRYGNAEIRNAEIAAGAAIAYAKLNLALSIVNADINAAAAIDYSKLNLALSILNADINAAAAIDESKLALNFATHAAFTAADHTAVGDGAPHHAEAHDLASHTTKAHAELTNVTPAQHHAVYLDADAVAAAEAAGLALASGKNIQLISALTADHTWSGLTATLVCGQETNPYLLWYAKDDGWMFLTDANLVAKMPAIAMNTVGITAGETGVFLLQGFVRDDSWDWTPGGLLYPGETNGNIVQIAPSGSGDQVQVIGVAITADIIYFNPSLELVEVA